MKIIVVCYDESPRLKYWDFNEKIIREIGLNRNTLDLEKYIGNYSFLPSTKEPLKRSRISCSEGHINIWNKIVNENLEDIIILEDDVVFKMDMENIETIIKYLPKDGITFLGGRFTNFKVKDMGKPLINKPIIKLGLNKLDTEQNKIMGSFSYYIPNKQVAEKMLYNSKYTKSKKYKTNMTDNLLNLVKTDIFFVYPSIFKQRIGLVSQIASKESLNKEHDNYTN
jgi:GR25 family glycosyltransferase involved in LPS biosynthesis